MTGTLALKKLTSLFSGSASRLRDLWEPLRGVLTFNLADDLIFPARNMAVSVDKHSVSIVYGTRSLSRVRIKGTRVYPLEEKSLTPEMLASSVSAASSSLRASKADITLCLPKAWTVLKIAEFPSTVKENITDVISYELDRLTPFSPEDARYDFRIVSEENGRLTVLIAAVKADLINPYLLALKERGYAVRRVTAGLTGIGTLCRFAGVAPEIIYLRITGTDYEGAHYSSGLLKGITTGSLGMVGGTSWEFDAAMASLERLVQEAKRPGRSPILCVAGDASPSLVDALGSRLSLPVKRVNDVFPKRILLQKDSAEEATGGVIESLWTKAQGMDLLTGGLHKKVRPPIVLTSLLLIALLTLAVVYFAAPVSIEKKRLEEIESQIRAKKESIRKVEALKKEVEELASEVAAINSFKGTKPMALNILKELTAVLPKTAWLTRVRITETNVDLEGYASSATELLPKLEVSQLFRKAEFASPTFRDARLNADRFNIKLEIEGARKEEPAVKEEAARKEDPAKKDKPEGGKGAKK